MKPLRTSMIILLALMALPGLAQDITGTWEGYMSGERIQINVQQNGKELCGYTYDYVLGEKSNYCKAYFKGRYVPERQVWLLEGQSFIENSGTHVLMRIRLWKNDNPGELEGAVYTKPAPGSIFGGMGSGDDLSIRKISSRPTKLDTGQPICFPEPTVNKSKDVPELVTIKPAPKPVVPPPVTKTAPPVIKVTPAPIPKAATKPVAKPPVSKPVVVAKPKPVPVKPELAAPSLKVKTGSVAKPTMEKPSVQAPALKKLADRKNTEMSRLEVNVRHINLKVYDNGVVDNDTVSIYYNGRMLVNKKGLSEKPIVIDLDLDEGVAVHEITLYAENLGSIPPNTALIVVTAGDKRYELRSKASLDENAVLVFEYKPK